MAVFSRCEAVLEADDSPMTVKTALQLINRELDEPLMHMAPVARVCHQMLRLRLGRGNG